jgi:urea carboxylase-associated protein 1
VSNLKHPSLDTVIPAGEPWIGIVRRGQLFRIVDLKGNQTVSTIFYNANDTHEHYSAQDTIQAQGGLYLTTGTPLRSNRGRPMLKIVEDSCGHHDTLAGACSAESNTVRYGMGKRNLHNCRDNFLLMLARHDEDLAKRDLPGNINFFMNAPVSPQGGLIVCEGRSAAGRHVQMQAQIDVLVLISNCPQLENPCNVFDPKPVRVLAWDTT